jgi:secreted PhoX family phosphatase
MTRQSPDFSAIVSQRYNRRQFLRGLGYGAGVATLASCAPAALTPSPAHEPGTSLPPASSFNFPEIRRNRSVSPVVAPGYRAEVLIRWGDPLFPDAPAFSPAHQSAEAQRKQFGFNNDYTVYIPLDTPKNGADSSHGLLCVNHEYTTASMMFPNWQSPSTRAQTEVEMAAHGHTVVEIKRTNGQWNYLRDSGFNRRITALDTRMEIRGPAAGSKRMQTQEDASGRWVIGTIGNCAGGITPWNTVLVAEENFDKYFYSVPKDHPEYETQQRYTISEKPAYDWHLYHDRFDGRKIPNEANRFGWVVEYDPFNPQSVPVKRTALGRVKHECATTAIAPDGRVVVYTGDDEHFQYFYRFVSHGKYHPENRDANRHLLDSGILYVARFDSNGEAEWLPLVHGHGPLTPENGFLDQADVLIDTRRAAELLGATPMDRPEDIAVHPFDGSVFVALTKNAERTAQQVNSANRRARNIHGHIIKLSPPAAKGKPNHAASCFRWDIFLEGGDPANPADKAFYLGEVGSGSWVSCPDNLAFDAAGRLWISTDGMEDNGGSNDGLFAVDTMGDSKGVPHLFFTVPIGAECTGPSFTPQSYTLFVAVQHPGEGSSYAIPTTRWPDFDPAVPPRPAVVAITSIHGEMIGGLNTQRATAEA